MADTLRSAQQVERQCFAVACACAAALLGALAWPTLRGQLYLDSDLGDFYVPVRAFYQRALQSGTEYLWYPYEFAGFYLHGEGQAGLYHPLNQLSYRWLPLTLAFGLEIVRGYAFALVGAFLFFRHHALPASAALLGAIFFAFSGFQVLHYMHPNVVAAVAHLPWQLLALDWMARGEPPLRRALAGPLLALLTASQLLLGHPQAVWLCAVVQLFYALMLWRSGGGIGLLARAGLAQVLGAAAAAIQLLPTWEALQDSLRNIQVAGFAASFALHPLDFVQLVQPYLFSQRVVGDSTTEFGLYAGGFGAIALGWLALAWREPGPNRRLARAALVLALLGALLAIGPSGRLQPLLSALPVVALFRAPCRYLLWIQLAASLAVALGFARLLACSGPLSRVGWIAVFAPALLSCLATLGVFFLAPDLARSPRFAVAGVVVLTATALVVAAAANGSSGARVALVLLACADLGIYGFGYISSRKPAPASLDAVRARIQITPATREYRQFNGPMINTLAGVRYVWGYVGMFPVRQLMAFPAHANGLPAAEERLGARQNALRVSSVVSAYWEPLPRARLVSDAQVTHDLHADLIRVDVADTALVSQPLELDAGQRGDAVIVSETAGELALVTYAPGRQLLVLSESFHEGWRAWIDGTPAEVVQVYGDYMGSVVPAGEHRVRFHFEPTSFRDGRRITALALAAILAWGGLALWRSRRGRGAAIEVGGEAARRQPQV